MRICLRSTWQWGLPLKAVAPKVSVADAGPVIGLPEQDLACQRP
jgi:hypothetical protein